MTYVKVYKIQFVRRRSQNAEETILLLLPIPIYFFMFSVITNFIQKSNTVSN